MTVKRNELSVRPQINSQSESFVETDPIESWLKHLWDDQKTFRVARLQISCASIKLKIKRIFLKIEKKTSLSFLLPPHVFNFSIFIQPKRLVLIAPFTIDYVNSSASFHFTLRTLKFLANLFSLSLFVYGWCKVVFAVVGVVFSLDGSQGIFCFSVFEIEATHSWLVRSTTCRNWVDQTISSFVWLTMRLQTTPPGNFVVDKHDHKMA